MRNNNEITARTEIEEIAVDSVAQAYLALMGARGVDYLFANAGTDFAPIIDALAHLAGEGKIPQPITVPHETVAAAMAHGYYLVSGRPQLVMCHVTVGTANMTVGVMNASRAKVPVIFTAGRTPLTEQGMRGSRNVYIHWAQESFDQGSLVREWVKWDYELRNINQLETVVDRALSIAMTEPRGPIYLTLPREVLSGTCERFVYQRRQRAVPAKLSHPEPEGLEEAAEALSRAANPLVIVGAMGAFPEAVPCLANLANDFVELTRFRGQWRSGESEGEPRCPRVMHGMRWNTGAEWWSWCAQGVVPTISRRSSSRPASRFATGWRRRSAMRAGRGCTRHSFDLGPQPGSLDSGGGNCFRRGCAV
jgi:hypothetical protein